MVGIRALGVAMVFLLLMVCAAQAQPATLPLAPPANWQQIPAPAKTTADGVRELLFGPAGELYVAFDTQGLWRTPDQGKIWHSIQHNLPAMTQGGRFCLTRERVLLFAPGGSANRGIQRLAPDAAEWTAASVDWAGSTGSDFISRLAVTKAGDVVAVTAGSRVLRSTDGGKTFKSSGAKLAGAALFDLAISPINPDELVLGTETGPVWRSTDGGATWNDIGTPVSAGDLRIAYNRLGELFASATHDSDRKGWTFARWTSAKEWVRSDAGLPNGADTRCAALAPSGLMFVGNTNVYVSGDDGKTWRLAAANFPAAGKSRTHVRVLAVGAGGLYAGVSSSESADRGIWTLAIAPATQPATAPAGR